MKTYIAPKHKGKVICQVCGEETELVEIYAGSYYDDAYGARKLHKVFSEVTACCKSADWDEIEELEEDKKEEKERKEHA